MEFQVSQAEVDEVIEHERKGSLIMTVGAMLLGMAMMVGLFWFQAEREGTWLWRIYVLALGTSGLVLVMVGEAWRRRLWSYERRH